MLFKIIADGLVDGPRMLCPVGTVRRSRARAWEGREKEAALLAERMAQDIADGRVAEWLDCPVETVDGQRVVNGDTVGEQMFAIGARTLGRLMAKGMTFQEACYEIGISPEPLPRPVLLPQDAP